MDERFPPMLTVSETATRLRMGVDTVLRLCQRGELPAHKFGKLWRVDAAKLDEMLKPGNYSAPVR